MALSFTFRRAILSAAPLAVRATARRAAHHAATTAPMLRGCCVPRELRRTTLRVLSTQILSFSTVSSDANLLRVIDAEITCALESAESDGVNDDIPSKFPFEMNDEPGNGIVTLTREFNGEKIQVIVSMPSVEVSDEGEDDEDQGEEDGRSSIPLVVTVSKDSGRPSLEFSCTAYPDEVVIDSLSIREEDKSDEDLAYEGPEFSDLDENLQKAFHKYLEIRGVTAATTNFLHEYMANKDNREYISWLKNLKDFISR